MDYYSRVKPILNKLKELQVFDSLDVVRKYIRASNHNQTKYDIFGISKAYANSIDIYFADFFIVNIIINSDLYSGKKSLRDVNTRYKIVNPIAVLHDEVQCGLNDKDPFVWLNSFYFNQANMRLTDNILLKLYRYYYLFNSANTRDYFEKTIGVSIEPYFLMTLLIYSKYELDNSFSIDEDTFLLDNKGNERFLPALQHILDSISKSFEEIKEMCKSCRSYFGKEMFDYYNDSPHIKYPIIKYDGKCYCVVPNYIIESSVNGLYYKLDIANGPENIKKEVSSNFENYVGLIFEHYFSNTEIEFKKELTYRKGKKGESKTSDWIIWDDYNICFIDCKMKRLTIEGKKGINIDYDTVESFISARFARMKDMKECLDRMPNGITKDLLEIGVGLGKLFVSYDDYRAGFVQNLPIIEKRIFHACLLTFEDTMCNSKPIKEVIIKIAQFYRDWKSESTMKINIEEVDILSVADVEKYVPTISIRGLSDFFESRNSLVYKKSLLKNGFIMDKFEKELLEPYRKESKDYRCS